MILAWMLFATTIATLLGLTAMAAEHVAAARRRPRRGIWLAALALSIAWPVVALARAAALAGSTASSALLPPMRATAAVERASAMLARGSMAAEGRGGEVLLVLWIVASALLLAVLVRRVRALAARRAAWRATTVDGVPVRLAPDVGPAVVGFRAREIVLPEWTLALDAPLRALVLRHEAEHCRAGDPFLLLASAIATALVPWNPALWWQARRVRLALEMDCDARVLAAHPTPERYGLLLLTIAQRRAVAMPLLAPALSEPASHLERRIVAMRSLATRISAPKLAAAIALAATAIIIACAVEAPSGIRSAARQSTAPRVATQPYFEFQVEKQVVPVPGSVPPRYPDALRAANVEGEVLAQFVVDTSGLAEPATFKVLKSSHELFTAAVTAAVTNMKFVPAEVGGRRVKQLVQMPFVFSLSH